MGVISEEFSLRGVLLMNRLLWYMFAGTRGGYTRGFILKHLTDKPYDASLLTDALKIDYKNAIPVVPDYNMVKYINSQYFSRLHEFLG